MNRHNFKRIMITVLVAVLVIQGCALANALSKEPEYPVYTLVSGETDAEGNVRPDYIVDNHGKVVEDVPMVRAADDYEPLPERYDARELNIITPAKNQAGSGACWSFSTVSCMETNFIQKGYGTVENTDFSEAHLAWFGQNQRCADTSDPTYGEGREYPHPFLYGANWNIAAVTVLRGSGMELEENAPWVTTFDENEMMEKMTQEESHRYVSHARMLDAWSVRDLQDRDTVKKLVMENGSVMTGYYDNTTTTNDGYNETNKCYFQCEQVGTSNHAVTIVGWDDNFPRTAFNEGNQPSRDGAWLIKGSWGTSERFGGGFTWLSYYDPSITTYASFTAEQADIYQNIYQYDCAYPASVINYNGSSASVANSFVAKNYELLSHVAFFSANPYCDATAEIYVGDVGSTIDGANPTANMKLVSESTTTRKNVMFGYSTIQLKKPVILKAGQRYTVKITMKTNNGVVIIAMEGSGPTSITPTSTIFSGNKGESFIYIGRWWDTNDYGSQHLDLNNVLVKAMTTNIEAGEPELEITQLPYKTEFGAGSTPDFDGLTLTYRDQWGIEETITEGFDVDLSCMNTPGTHTLTFTYKGLTCTMEIQVIRVPGDANGDGEVDLRDVVTLERSLVGGHGATIVEVNAEVNNDGEITAMDAVLIKRYLVGGYRTVLQ